MLFRFIYFYCMKFTTNIDWFYLFVRPLTILLAFILGCICSHFFQHTSYYMGGMLAAISAIIVFTDTDIKSSFSGEWKRIVASFIGALIGYIYFLLFDFSIWGMTACIFLINLIALLCSLKGYGRIAIIVIIWIFVKSTLSDVSPLVNGMMRFLESTLGVLVGLVALWLLLMFEKWLSSTQNKNKDDGTQTLNQNT